MSIDHGIDLGFWCLCGYHCDATDLLVHHHDRDCLLDVDTASSVSCQHFIDTGRYLLASELTEPAAPAWCALCGAASYETRPTAPSHRCPHGQGTGVWHINRWNRYLRPITATTP